MDRLKVAAERTRKSRSEAENTKIVVAIESKARR